MKKRMQKLFTVMLIISVMMSMMSMNVYAAEFYNCGFTSEHTHKESTCFADQLICTKHVHDETCYDAEHNLICEDLGDVTCGIEEHAHGDACYHKAHGEECYHAHSDLCKHVHDETCYHQHVNACYAYICGLEGVYTCDTADGHEDHSNCPVHVHVDACKTLVCTEDITVEKCQMTPETLVCQYAQVEDLTQPVCGIELNALTCEAAEHAHEAACYTSHEHTKAKGCFEKVLVCQMDSGHKHTSDCLVSPKIMIDKTADGLDANDMTNVTLNVGGEESDLPVDIIYILGAFLDTPEKVEANIMIQCLVDTFEEIIEQGTTVNFGIVPFSSTEEAVLPFEKLDEVSDLESLPEKISAAVVRAGNVYDAVNMENALMTADQMFSASDLGKAGHTERQHLVMISSGHTYYFNSGENNENIATVPVHFVKGNLDTDEIFYMEKVWMRARNNNTNSYPIPKVIVEEYKKNTDKYSDPWECYWDYIEQWTEADRAAGDAVVYNATTRAAGDFISWFNSGNYSSNTGSDGKGGTFTYSGYGAVMSGVKASDTTVISIDMSKALEEAVAGPNPLTDESAAHAISYERAMYEAYEYLTENITAKGINFYPIYNMLRDDGSATNGSYKHCAYTDQYIGHCFMNMLAGGTAVQYSKTDNKAFFDPIKRSIVNSVADGSYVVDYIGYDDVKGDFNFIEDAAAMTLVKNGVEYVTAKLDIPNADVTRGGKNYGTATSSYTFTAPDAENATFTVDYFAGEADKEFFIWTFYEPVSNLSPASLTYKLHLTNKADIKDVTQIVDTNINATLYPVDSDQVPGTPQIFPVPNVEYIVTDEVVPPTVPQDPPEDPVNPPYIPPYNPPVEPPAEPPLVEVEDPEVPLEDLEDPDVPLAEIEEEEVPRTDVPKTADNTNLMLWLAMAALSAMALLAMRMTEKKEY